MTNKENNIEVVLEALCGHLRDYLAEKGVIIDKKDFHRCISPTHEDKNPSSCIGGDPKYADRVTHCFSCHKNFNILHAVNIFEKKSITGIEFFSDTLPYLAKKYNIEYVPTQLTEDQKAEIQRRRSYEDAVEILHTNAFKDGKLKTDHPGVKHLLDRGITEETIKKFQIGFIEEFRDYLQEMYTKGWSNHEYLASADLTNRKLFHKNGIIIPIFDHKNRPVAFVTRRTDIEQGEKGTEKFVNSLNSNIYHKSEILFNFNNYDDKKGPLYIVEGYLDAIYLTQVGLPNVVAIGATVLTEAHVEMLHSKDVKDIKICMDADQSGRDGVKLALERLSPYKKFKIKVIDLPEGDPDTYVEKNGLESFRELGGSKSLSPFAWTIKYTTFEDDPLRAALNAIPAIVNEPSNIQRLRMIKELAALTGIPEQEIKKDVDDVLSKESSAYLDDLTEVNNWVQITLNKKKIRDTKNILSEAIAKVKHLENKYNSVSSNTTEYNRKITETIEKITEGRYKDGLVAPNYSRFIKNFDGFPFTCNLTVMGGRPSSGKTVYITALEMDMIEANKDLIILDMSIDDMTELRLLKMVASKSGCSVAEVKKYNLLSPEDKLKVDEAWVWVRTYSDRLIITDSTAGNSVDNLEQHVEWLLKTYPNHKKLVVLDNFHKLRSPPTNKKSTDLVSDLSQRIKDITQLNDLSLIMTVELRKLENTFARPTLSDLKDAVQMEYDADVAILVHNDYQTFKAAGKDTNIAHDTVFRGVVYKMPYIEVTVAKNKVTGKIDNFGYKLNSFNLQVTEIPYSEIEAKKPQIDRPFNAGPQGRNY